ncbi:hypothetical protein PPSIR1_04643 [Plesiocystis pacifica SIR-1]|uniref:Lipoprotein n=1 Tax=Plesiocystis pacifica SIR-1 TaxID=391625 RepID=A6FWQ1_9BACT|nr:hypothetical protein [Plesiocystis pacifica]EDM81725.1 hypothetical protein PPSIR1_04643 [Plesiocystis pacifica SIR-1]
MRAGWTRRAWLGSLGVGLGLGCASSTDFLARSRGQRAALVSCTARFVDQIQVDDDNTITVSIVPPQVPAEVSPAYLTRLRVHVEHRMGQHWRVLPSARFVTRSAYQELQSTAPPHLAPVIEGYPFRCFGRSRGALARLRGLETAYTGRLDLERGQALAALLGADYIASVEYFSVGWCYLGVYDRDGALVLGNASPAMPMPSTEDRPPVEGLERTATPEALAMAHEWWADRCASFESKVDDVLG